MSKLGGRVGRMERAKRLQQEQESSQWLINKLNRMIVRDEPDLVLVEPCDTDPETYLEIAETVASARGDNAEVERLRALRKPEPPIEWSGDEREDIRRINEDMSRHLDRSVKLTTRAIAKARKRLGLSPLHKQTKKR